MSDDFLPEDHTEEHQDQDQQEFALTPKAYSAPRPAVPAPTKKELDMVLRAQLEPHPGSNAEPLELERHVLLTVRPGEGGGEYANRRVVGWMREIERIGKDALDQGEYALGLRAFSDLTRMWQIQQTREQKNQQDQAKSGDLHLHQHNHQHSEIPDLSRVPADQLSALTQAFAQQVDSAKRDPRRRMDQQEAQAYDAYRQRLPSPAEKAEVIDITPSQSEEPQEEGEREDDKA